MSYARFSVALFTLFPLLSLMVGCATVRTQGDESVGEEAPFKESAADVMNRAPSSMSVPGELREQNSGGNGAFERTQADYHFSLAETFSLQGDSARAIEEYKLTLIYDPSSAEVRVRLAAEYLKQGLISEALEHAKAAVEKNPKFVDAHLLLGGLYSALRMYDGSLREYRSVLEIQPENMEAPLFIGAILAEQKKYGQAARQFESLAKNPNNSNQHVAWYYLGRVYLEEEKAQKPLQKPAQQSAQSAKAEAAFLQSLSTKANYTESVLALGQLYENTARKEKALKLYQSFQERHGPSGAVAEELARMFIEAKQYAKAFEQLAVLEASDPSDINVKAKMAFILIEQQKYHEAIVRLEEVLALEPTSDKIRFYLGAVYEELKDYKSAVTHLKKVPPGSGYFNEAIVHTAYLYKLLGDYGRAIETIENGIKAKDDHVPFYALYASLLDDQKEYQKAADMLAEAVKKIPNQAQLYFFLGNMQDRVGDKEGTIASMSKVLELDKNHVQALNFLAYTYAESGRDLAEAEKMARRAVDLQPNDGYILDTLGWILFKRGQVGEAVRLLEAAYKVQPNESVIAEHLGDAYYHQQLPEKARKLYLRAAENESNVVIVEKIRSKISAIDRQMQNINEADARKPASTADHK